MASTLLSAFWLFDGALASLEHEAPASGMYSQPAGSYSGSPSRMPDVENIHSARHKVWSSSAHLSMAWLGVIWYCFVWLVCSVGCLQIRRRYSNRPMVIEAAKPVTQHRPFVTILRPIKGLDPHLSLTLKSSFLQDYPSHLHEILLCVASAQDPCIPIVRSLIARYPGVSARLVLGEEDVGPNPKIRTLSKGYREARGDIVWMLDSNIWVAPGVLARSVRTLCGHDELGGETRMPYKFLHHLPVGVDCDEEPLPGVDLPIQQTASLSSVLPSRIQHFFRTFGGTLEETFLSTSHSKFYTAINIIAIAPCTLGKSNMFRKSHLAAVTAQDAPGILDFAHNICEDHMLAERIWLRRLPAEIAGTEKWGKHALGDDLVFQPMANMTLRDYCERRTRWLRVRKYAVIAATLAEPETESFLCSLIGGYGFITLLEHYGLHTLLVAPESWSKPVAIFWFWVLSVMVWSLCDYANFRVLHGFANIPLDTDTPRFIRGVREKLIKRRWEGSLTGWLCQWGGREALALPIFLWAMLPGDVWWRGGRYRVGWDMKVRKVGQTSGDGKRTE